MFAAAVLDLYAITRPSLWMDEGFSIFMARTDAANFWNFVRGGEINMILYYGLLRAWMRLGTSEFWIRLFSAIGSIATVPVVYAIGRRLSGTRLAAVAALLFAVHPAEVAFAQEARSYALAIFLVAVSCLFLLRLIERPAALNAVGYALTSALAVYTHLFAVLVIAAQWMWLALFVPSRLRRRSVFLAGAALAVLVAPLGWAALGHSRQAVNWVPPLRLADLAQLGFLLGLPRWRIVMYLAAWSAAIVAGVRGRWSGSSVGTIGFVACWLFVPVVLAVAVSFHKPVLVPRFLLVCLPASVLLAAWGLSRIRASWALVGVVLIAFASLNSVLAYYRHLGWKENWRGASAYVLAHAELGDTVVVVPTYARFTFDYYRQQAEPKQLVYADLISTGAPHTWLLVSTVGMNLPGTREALTNLAANAIVETQHFDAIDVMLVATQSQNHAVVSDGSITSGGAH